MSKEVNLLSIKTWIQEKMTKLMTLKGLANIVIEKKINYLKMS